MGEFHDFPSQIFSLTIPKKFGGTLLWFKNFLVWKKNMDKKGGVTFFRRKLFVPNRQKTSWANPSVFQKRSGIKNFLDNSGITILSIFLSHSTENFHMRTLVFQNFSGIENFLDNELSRFCWFLLSHIAEKHHGWTLLCFRNVLESKNIWITAVSRFCWTFCLTVPKHFVGGPLRLRNVLVSKNFSKLKYHDFVEFFFSHRQKSPWANCSVFQNCSGIKIFWIIRVSRFSWLFLSHSAEIFVENLSMI